MTSWSFGDFNKFHIKNERCYTVDFNATQFDYVKCLCQKFNIKFLCFCYDFIIFERQYRCKHSVELYHWNGRAMQMGEERKHMSIESRS